MISNRFGEFVRTERLRLGLTCQKFAEKIEAIEKQKQIVTVTKRDLETLLASRMQYWFE